MTTSQNDSLEALILSIKNPSKPQIFFLKYLKTLENPKILHKSNLFHIVIPLPTFVILSIAKYLKNKREVLWSLALLKITKRRHRDFSHFANVQNDKIGETDDNRIKNCNDKADDKVTESKNDTSNDNRNTSLALKYDKNAMAHSNTNYLKAT